jgi:general secretion pathway protein N
MRRCAWIVAAIASFYSNGAIGKEPVGVSFQESDFDQKGPAALSNAAATKNLDAKPPPGGNPLWGIPISSLSATRERPIFSPSRRPPAPPTPPVPVAETPPPPPPPAKPEQPPFTLVGTAIGKPQNVALILDQTTKNLVRLHVGEAVSGWYLRSVDLRTMTLEKNSQTVTLSLPAPASPPALAAAARISRKF